MNKAELVQALAVHYGGSRIEATRALNAVVQTITHATASGERVAITGFGVFERVERPARMVRNPRTGERVEAAATSVPRFRPGTELKAYVAGLRALPAVVAVEPGLDSTAGSTPAAPRRPRPAAPAAPAAPEKGPVVVPAAPPAGYVPAAAAGADGDQAAKSKKAKAKDPRGKGDKLGGKSGKDGKKKDKDAKKKDKGSKKDGKKSAGKGKKG